MGENLTTENNKRVNVSVNPISGEQQVTGEYNALNIKTFDDIINDINKSNFIYDTISNSKDDFIKEISNNPELNFIIKEGMKPESIYAIIDIANKIIAGEHINIYNSFPDEVKKMVDNYVDSNSSKYITGAPYDKIKPIINSMRKQVSINLIERFISITKQNTAKQDFANQLSKLYMDNISNIHDVNNNVDFIAEQNKLYKEKISEINDVEKRDLMMKILDQIDNAKSLSNLIEFANICKIKPIELEKPKRVFDILISKYVKSNNVIYSIDVARNVLLRHMNNDDKFANQNNIKNIDIFFIVFCKQIKSYSVDNPVDHAYMYYVMYYCAMLDIVDHSGEFINNVYKVIQNSKIRNNLK